MEKQAYDRIEEYDSVRDTWIDISGRSNIDVQANVDVESNIDIAPCCCNCGYAKVIPSYWTREYDHAIPWVRGQWHKCRCAVGPKHEHIIKEEDSCPLFYCRF